MDNFIIFLIITFGIYIWLRSIFREKEENERQRSQAKKIPPQNITRNEYIKGKQIIEDLGWVRCDTISSYKDAYFELSWRAADLGANAITRVVISPRRGARYEAGKGYKGNPFYRHHDLAEGRAVIIQ